VLWAFGPRCGTCKDLPVSAFDLTRSNYREEFELGKRHASLDIPKNVEPNLAHLFECSLSVKNAATFLLNHPSKG
jgi:hypothetical protein